jgi:hypothetical protein
MSHQFLDFVEDILDPMGKAEILIIVSSMGTTR